MKIFLSKINESWIVDRMRSDWYEYNNTISTENIGSSNIIWIISPWLWKKIPKRYLKTKNVVCSIYHIDFEIFDKKERREFFERDKYVDFYHVISLKTKEQLQTLTEKEIVSIPLWVNLISALSDLSDSLYSALDVNILYGSATPLVTRSSIITPM